MSGGAFEYKQYKIEELIEDMKLLLERVDKEPTDSFECDSLKISFNPFLVQFLFLFKTL